MVRKARRASTGAGAGAPNDSESHSATSGVALYARLAASLRTRILAGEWSKGDQLPTIDALAEAYGVALVTARRAVRSLVEEGLLSSARGRGTHLRAVPGTSVPNPGLRAAINDAHILSPEHVINVLSRRQTRLLPPDLAAGYALAQHYVHVQKTHSFRETPFALMDIFVERGIFREFPRGAERTTCLSPSIFAVSIVECLRIQELCLSNEHGIPFRL